ncbi:MAG TPA: inorganic diphosphatase [Parafilimonas sp.]|nr:inorganic diphosphatase [Parafilimonas sp.]
MKTVMAIVETPRGSAEKYDYDPKNKWFKLSKIMPSGMVFPFDFGFIPDTEGEDGDPLDIIIISELKSFPGCVMDCRIIGGITAKQTEKGKTVRNDRFLAVPAVSQFFSKVKSIDDLPEDIIDEIEKFFMNYNELAEKKFKPLKRIDASKALKLIKHT